MDVRYALNPVGSLVGRHLLVVEDDKDARTVRPHAVITDIVRPGRDGFWLLEQLRGARGTQTIPVVAVTAVAGREEILDAGFDAYLCKPVRPEGVADAVLAALALRADPDGPPPD